MKTSFLLIFSLLASIVALPLMGQDQPDGFASVSGKGVETTTGGQGGEVIIADSYNILSRFARSDDPYIIIVKGKFESTNWKQVNVGSNTTIVGYGTDATLSNIGLVMVDEQNIIIRNLNIVDSYVEGDWEGKTNDYDGIRVDNSHHVWIDHCFLSHLGDGLIDLRKNSDFITVSYNQLNNHNKAFGVGWTDETEFQITIHHCWIDSTNQRNPSFDQGIGHLYNNYLSNVSSYGNLSRGAARVIVQNSHFYKTNDPLRLSDNAVLYSSNNTFENCSGNKSGNITTMPFNPADFYPYTLDPVEQVPEIVMANSGPQQAVSDQYEVSSSANAPERNTTGMRFSVNTQSKTLRVQGMDNVPTQLWVYTLDGKLAFSANLPGTDTQQVSLQELHKGIYLLKATNAHQTQTGKFVLR